MIQLNWGWRIAIVYTSFVVLILYMVYRSVQMSTELVTPNYYAEELDYQSHIDKVNRTTQLSTELQWKVNDRKLDFSFPAELTTQKISAEVFFYCPSDSKKDVTLHCEAANGIAELNVTQLQQGVYQMKVEWKADNTTYYNEGTITLN